MESKNELTDQTLEQVNGGYDHNFYMWRGTVYTKLYSDCPGQNNYGCMKCPHKDECADFSLLDWEHSGLAEEGYNQERRA